MFKGGGYRTPDRKIGHIDRFINRNNKVTWKLNLPLISRSFFYKKYFYGTIII